MFCARNGTDDLEVEKMWKRCGRSPACEKRSPAVRDKHHYEIRGLPRSSSCAPADSAAHLHNSACTGDDSSGSGGMLAIAVSRFPSFTWDPPPTHSRDPDAWDFGTSPSERPLPELGSPALTAGVICMGSRRRHLCRTIRRLQGALARWPKCGATTNLHIVNT